MLEVILNTEDFSDLLTRLELLKLISEQDGELLLKLEAEKEEVAAIEEELGKANLEAIKIKDEIEAKKRETEWMLELKQKRLNSLSSELKELLRKEAARKAAEQARLIAKIKQSVHAKAGTLVATALKYLGIPYVWGGESTRGVDCSGLLKCVFSVHGVNLPHYSGSQFRLGTAVAKENLAPGDAVFFGSPIHHVGIYVGDGNFIHAPRTGDVVRITPLAERTDYAGARRYI
ncbi:MAG: NlpC/P60 family protein [Actinomycetota bacterium]|nr:NlpC/P60 family protein [Actinomycetota bacterium]